jgi:DUF971 family protein
MKIRQIDQVSSDVVVVSWEDGDQSLLFLKKLRANCPCAVCKDERENANPLKVLAYDPDSLELKRWRWVGRYAIALEWSDGHNTGIYTYEYLRELSE